jgi:hypothetical protein
MSVGDCQHVSWGLSACQLGTVSMSAGDCQHASMSVGDCQHASMSAGDCQHVSWGLSACQHVSWGLSACQHVSWGLSACQNVSWGLLTGRSHCSPLRNLNKAPSFSVLVSARVLGITSSHDRRVFVCLYQLDSSASEKKSVAGSR